MKELINLAKKLGIRRYGSFVSLENPYMIGTLFTINNIETVLKNIGCNRYIITEDIGVITLEIPPKFIFDATTNVDLWFPMPNGVKLYIKPLPWWLCWFAPRQYNDIR